MSDNRAHMSDLAFFAVLLSTVALVWIFPVFPTQDGPAHLENARLLVELLRGNAEVGRFFAFDRFSPNWISHLVLAPLLLIVLVAMALFRGRAWWRPTALAMLPGVVLVFAFLGGHESTESGGGPERWPLFSTLGVLVSFAPIERTLSTILWILLGAVAVFEACRLPRKRSWRDGLLLAAVPFLALTFTAPFFL